MIATILNYDQVWLLVAVLLIPLVGVTISAIRDWRRER